MHYLPFLILTTKSKKCCEIDLIHLVPLYTQFCFEPKATHIMTLQGQYNKNRGKNSMSDVSLPSNVLYIVTGTL